MSSQDQQRMPNGRPKTRLAKPPKRWDEAIFTNVFPDTNIGRLLHGISIQFLIKQEHRMGWPYRGACSEVDTLLDHPNETVAAHMWGVAQMIQIVSEDEQFKKELPNFNLLAALRMALMHDVPELITTDITKEDPMTREEKNKAEAIAMGQILSRLPESIGETMHEMYRTYELKSNKEAEFVKDCDRLDFMIYAFVLERQGFNCITEFYTNTMNDAPMYTNIASELAEQLCKTRNELLERGCLYVPKP